MSKALSLIFRTTKRKRHLLVGFLLTKDTMRRELKNSQISILWYSAMLYYVAKGVDL
jgi:hypothetical protein